MDLEILNNREIKPQKVATKQGEANTTILRFTRDSYKYDQIDLRNYKAYAVTCCNGEIDMSELTMTVNGSSLILTWSLSERVLRYNGAIVYQISFKADKDSAAVFNTYQGIIQNSASIDESTIVGDYPTIMKQWLDLINARSGTIPNKVAYMLPGNSVPIEERTEGTLYFQWEEAATMNAASATGIVNLGSTPYADSGLYINGTHVCVDDTSDTVFVLEPSVWVDAINSANCGVIASDISSGENVKILLTAKTAGASGNAITYELGLAQYGAGKGLNNPSNGTTYGATLTGGYDTQVGVENPIGQLEDHFGNVLARTGAKLVPDANLDELLADGEYICSGSFDTPISCTYCMLRVTDSPSTSRIIQECYVVDLNDHTVRTFVRAVSGGTTFGAWRELMTDQSAVRYPDYATAVSRSNDVSYTATTNGWVYLRVNQSSNNISTGFTVDGVQVVSGFYHGHHSSTSDHILIPVKKGSIYRGAGFTSITWFNCK